jgi:hypothetical protein
MAPEARLATLVPGASHQGLGTERDSFPLLHAPPGDVYNGSAFLYNDDMAAVSYVMTISQNGQVSIPADARSRWAARRVVVVDLGDRVVVRPLPDDGVDELEGKYRGKGPAADEARRHARREDAGRTKGR